MPLITTTIQSWSPGGQVLMRSEQTAAAQVRLGSGEKVRRDSMDAECRLMGSRKRSIAEYPDTCWQVVRWSRVADLVQGCSCCCRLQTPAGD